jgi:hypothetical protein
MRVLFVGNSLTAVNDLPGTVAQLAQADGQPRPIVQMTAIGGFSLEDHWNRGDAQRAIAGSRWDVVVLQQGPSALPESRQLLIEYARRFAGVIRKAGAKPALYMVWPSSDRRADARGVSQSYRAAAKAVNGLLFAAGDAWSLAMQRRRDLRLYSDDGLHPTIAGTYLAASVVYQGLYDRSPVGLPPVGGLSANDARFLQETATEVRDLGLLLPALPARPAQR